MSAPPPPPPTMTQSALPPPVYPPYVDSDPKNLIVNYIPTPVTDEHLRGLFERFGTIHSARVIVDRATNHPKGYGFVKFTTEESARLAIATMNGYEIHNKRLRVTQANGPQNRSIQQYTNKVVHLQSVPTQPGSSTAQVGQTVFLSPQAYTVVGTGQPIYPSAATTALPTVMLANPTSATPPAYSYINFNGATTAPPAPPPQGAPQANNTVVIDVDGMPMQLMANGPLPPMFQQTPVAYQQVPGAPTPPAGGVRPLCFAPFRPGSPQSDPLMHSSFQLSVASALNTSSPDQHNQSGMANVMARPSSLSNLP